MSLPDDSSRLIHAVYAAATGDLTWDEWLRGLAEALGAAATSLLFSERPTWGDAFELLVGHGYDETAAARYAAHFAAVDVRFPVASRLLLGQVFRDGLQMPFSAVERSEIFADFYRPQGIGRGMGLRLTCPGQGHGLLGAFRPLNREGFSPSDEALLRAISPHVVRAIAVQRRLADAAALDTATRSGLDRLRVAMVVVDENLVVRRANAAAEALLEQPNSPVQRRAGKLRDPSSAIARAVTLVFSSPGDLPPVLRITRPGGEGSISLLLFPASTHSALGAGAPRLAVILMSDSQQRFAVERDVLRTEFALTAAEADVAIHLLFGASVAEIAQRRRASIETVRVQVKSLQLKTQCRSQAQLVAAFAQSLAATSRPTGVTNSC